MFKEIMFKMKSTVVNFGILAFIFTNLTVVHADEHKHLNNSSIVIESSWARALPPVVPNGAAYLSIVNHGKNDTLLDVSSSIATNSMVHESYIADGQVSMRHINEIDIATGQHVEFKPGGYHIMLMGLKTPLSVGTHFKITLMFENAGEIEVHVPVLENKGINKGNSHH